MSARPPIIILGAGPAGLGAAYKIAQRGRFDVQVFEQRESAGGYAGSFDLDGIHADYGSHRLHPACSPRVMADISRFLGADLLDRPRHGRIRLRGRWVHFPLKPLDAGLHLPPSFILGVLRDSVFRAAPPNGEENFATVLQQGLGRTICRDFYFPYARKIWGMDAEALDAEQARRRVSANSVGKLFRKVLKAVPGVKKTPGFGRFFYPKRGYGQISDAYLHAAQSAGATVRFNTRITRIELDGRRATTFIPENEAARSLAEGQILSTIPLPALVNLLYEAAPASVKNAAKSLRYRSMLLIYLVLETNQFTEFDAHYFPGSDVRITRLSEPKNYAITDRPGRTVLCAELPCAADEPIFSAPEAELGQVVLDDLAHVGLRVQAPVRQVVVKRLPSAYPIYTSDFREHFSQIDSWLNGMERVLTFGRQGLFAHDNTHHALEMAYSVNDCLRDDGSIDRDRWAHCRREFEKHVVED